MSARMAASARSFQTRATLFEAAASRLGVAPQTNKNRTAPLAKKILLDGNRGAWNVSGFIQVKFQTDSLQLTSEIDLVNRWATTTDSARRRAPLRQHTVYYAEACPRSQSQSVKQPFRTSTDSRHDPDGVPTRTRGRKRSPPLACPRRCSPFCQTSSECRGRCDSGRSLAPPGKATRSCVASAVVCRLRYPA